MYLLTEKWIFGFVTALFIVVILKVTKYLPFCLYKSLKVCARVFVWPSTRAAKTKDLRHKPARRHFNAEFSVYSFVCLFVFFFSSFAAISFYVLLNVIDSRMSIVISIEQENKSFMSFGELFFFLITIRLLCIA